MGGFGARCIASVAEPHPLRGNSSTRKQNESVQRFAGFICVARAVMAQNLVTQVDRHGQLTPVSYQGAFVCVFTFPKTAINGLTCTQIDKQKDGPRERSREVERERERERETD